MLCHIHQLTNPASFLERLARSGCAGVLLELHLGDDDPRFARSIAQICSKLRLQLWVMPIIKCPPAKHRAWMLDVSIGAPRPVAREGILDMLSGHVAEFLFHELKAYIKEPPHGIFLQSPFADSAEPFPWTPDFEKYFSKQHDYDFRKNWHSLVSTTGADDAKVRQDYWVTVNTQLSQFLQQCTTLSHSIKSTFRHNIIEPELAALSLPEHAIYRKRGAHSIEIIHFSNWPQLLKSTFDCYVNDALHVAVSLPEDFDEEPAAAFFHTTQSVVSVLNKGANVARVGLLFPQRSARTHYHPKSHRYSRWVGEDFTRMIGYLESMHYDYRLIEEKELHDPPCELLVISSITAISTESWVALEAWIKRGGKVACAGLLPRWSERGLDGELEERISRATKQTLQDVYDGYIAWEQGTAMPPHIGYPIFGEDLSGGRLCSYTPRLNHDAEDARLRLSQIFRESLQSDFSSQNMEVVYRHLINDKGQQFVIYNNSDQTQHLICRCISEGPESPRKIVQYEFDKINPVRLATSESVQPVLVWSNFSELEGGGISLSMTMAPHQLRIYEMQFNEDQIHLTRSNFHVERIAEDAIHGVVQEMIRPFCVQDDDGKTKQWIAPKVLLPSPLWMNEEEWEQQESTFTGVFFIPEEWKAYRVLLETRPEEAAVQLFVNQQNIGIAIAPPFLFDVSAAINVGENNQFTLRTWQTGNIIQAPARLVAWQEIRLPLVQEAP